MMNSKILYTAALCALLLSACNLPLPMMKSGGDSASIIYPLDGAQLQVGDFVDVKTLAALTSGATSAILYVNDAPYRADNLSQPIASGTIYQPWTPTEPGTFTLRARLIASDGEVDSNSVTVIVGTAIPAEAPTLPAAPTDIIPSATLPPGVTAVPPSATATVVFAPPTWTSTAISIPPTWTAVPYIPPTWTPTIIANSSLLGQVYRDENGNGNLNPADTPLAGITVLLGAGACPSSGLASAQTGADGKYAFYALPAGTYCLTVNTDSLPNIGGTWQPSLPNPINATVGQGESLGGRNFMFQPIIQ